MAAIPKHAQDLKIAVAVEVVRIGAIRDQASGLEARNGTIEKQIAFLQGQQSHQSEARTQSTVVWAAVIGVVGTIVGVLMTVMLQRLAITR